LRKNIPLLVTLLREENINSNKETRFREIIIPGDVLEDDRLSDGAKIMYGKIARLSLSDGRCWSSNSFLDGTKSGRNASRFIAELKEAGYILIENDKSRFRKISICRIESKINLANSGDVEKPDAANLANSGEVKNSEEPDLANSGDVNAFESPYLANSGDVDGQKNANLAKFGDRTSSSSNIYIKTTTASGPPDNSGLPAIEAAAGPVSQKELRDAVSALDKKLILGVNFYARAPSFLYRNGLSLDYVSWIYGQSLAKADTLNSYFFTVFFLDSKVEEFKAGLLPEEKPPGDKPPPGAFSCPVCGREYDYEMDICYTCCLPNPASASNDDVALHRALYDLPPDKREEYINREGAAIVECIHDPEKLKSMLAALKSEFGLEAGARV